MILGIAIVLTPWIVAGGAAVAGAGAYYVGQLWAQSWGRRTVITDVRAPGHAEAMRDTVGRHLSDHVEAPGSVAKVGWQTNIVATMGAQDALVDVAAAGLLASTRARLEWIPEAERKAGLWAAEAYRNAEAAKGVAVGLHANLRNETVAWTQSLRTYIDATVVPGIVSYIDGADAALWGRVIEPLRARVDTTNARIDALATTAVPGLQRGIDDVAGRVSDVVGSVIPGAVAGLDAKVAGVGAAVAVAAAATAAVAARADTIERCAPKCGTPVQGLLRGMSEDLAGELGALTAIFGGLVLVPGYAEALAAVTRSLPDLAVGLASVFRD